MAKEVANIRGVVNRYGAFSTGDTIGHVKTEGGTRQLVLDLTGKNLVDKILQPVYMPAKAHVKKAYLFVTEAFDLGAGTVVEVGEAGAEATNGVSLLEVNLETAGAYVDVSSQAAGEWATAATAYNPAEVLIDIALSAGSVADSTVGKARLVVEYELFSA